MEAIAAASGAPTGTLYHRFGSRDELIARLWMRAVYRSQASFVAAMERDEAREAALAAAMSIIDFCEEHPEDARLLVAFRREDLIRALPDGPVAEELQVLNRPVERAVVQLAQRLYRTRSRTALDRTLLVVLDLPYGAARRHLLMKAPLPAYLRADLRRAIAAAIDAPLAAPSSR
jgi:AcrR family transcriptional regulator